MLLVISIGGGGALNRKQLTVLILNIYYIYSIEEVFLNICLLVDGAVETFLASTRNHSVEAVVAVVAVEAVEAVCLPN